MQTCAIISWYLKFPWLLPSFLRVIKVLKLIAWTPCTNWVFRYRKFHKIPYYSYMIAIHSVHLLDVESFDRAVWLREYSASSRGARYSGMIEGGIEKSRTVRSLTTGKTWPGAPNICSSDQKAWFSSAHTTRFNQFLLTKRTCTGSFPCMILRTIYWNLLPPTKIYQGTATFGCRRFWGFGADGNFLPKIFLIMGLRSKLFMYEYGLSKRFWQVHQCCKLFN